MEFFTDISFWHWLVLGGILMLGEMFFPGAIFLWVGISAIFVGLINFLFPDANQYLLLALWGAFSLSFALAWQVYIKKYKRDVPESLINRRGAQYIGRFFTLKKPVVNNVGEMHVGDTRWRIVADQDIPAGAKVKVVAVDGSSLKVEDASAADPASTP